MRTNKVCAVIGNLTKFDALLPLTQDRPLATLPFDSKYRLIDFNLSSVANAKIKSLLMVFNEDETRSIYDHIGGGKEWNLEGVQNRFFVHTYQSYERLGDENASYYEAIIDYLEKSKSEYTVYLGNKILCNVDLRAILSIAQAKDAEMLAVYKRVDPSYAYSKDTLLVLDESHQLKEKKLAKDVAEVETVNLAMDIFLIKTDRLISELRSKQQNKIKGTLQQFLYENLDETTTLYEYTGYLNNIYDIPSYYQANMDMLDISKFNSLLYSSQKVYTKLKNEVPTYYSASSQVTNSQFATGCTVNGTVDYSLVSRGTTIETQATVSHSLLFSNNQIGAGATIRYAILDKNVTVAPGIVIEGTEMRPVVVRKGTHVKENIIGG